MVWRLCLHDLKFRYFGSFFGMYWNFLHPMITILVFVVLFRDILKIRIPGFELEQTSYGEFFVCGLIPWIAFSDCLRASITVFEGDQGLLMREIPLDKRVLFLRSTVTTSINLGIGLLIFTLYLLAHGNLHPAGLAYLPIILPFQILCTVGLSMINALLCAFFRDFREISLILINLAFFATPIIYSIDLLPTSLQWIITFNPLTPLFESWRAAFLNGVRPVPAFFYFFLPFSLLVALIGSVLVRRFDGAVTEVS